MIVLSLGGSLINPGSVDVSYLNSFKKMILSSKEKCVIVCGGGVVARQYIRAASVLSKTDADRVGIAATMLNASLLGHAFGSKVQSIPRKTGGRLTVAGGWNPGNSTDYCAVMWAVKNDVKTVYNLTNIDYVYDKDPQKFRSAKPLKDLAWDDYLELVGKWKSGLHSPFDPVASRAAKRHGIKVVILDGKKLNNLHRALSGRSFVGTVIR